MLYLILFEYERGVSLYRDGSSAVNCPLITGRNVKNLSLENVDLILFLARKSMLKGMVAQL